MFSYDVQYQDITKRILNEGTYFEDRTGVGTIGVFDVNLRVDLSRDDGRFSLPALGLRKVFPRSAWMELFWMLRGSLDARELKERNIRIWEGNSTREFLDSRGLHGVREGFIGRSGYGKLFRNFDGTDQLASLIDGVINNPLSRRHFISLWHPGELEDMALPCCHTTYNFMVEGDKLHLKFFQRSGDWVLGTPMNLMFSAFFLSWVASRTGYKVGTLAHSITNCHIYTNHIEVAEELIEREPIPHTASFEMPKSFIEEPSVIFDDPAIMERDINDMWESGWDTVSRTLDYTSHAKIDPSRLIMAV